MIIVKTGWDNNVRASSPFTEISLTGKDEKASKSTRKERTGVGPLAGKKFQQNSGRLKMAREWVSGVGR